MFIFAVLHLFRRQHNHDNKSKLVRLIRNRQLPTSVLSSRNEVQKKYWDLENEAWSTTSLLLTYNAWDASLKLYNSEDNRPVFDSARCDQRFLAVRECNSDKCCYSHQKHATSVPTVTW